MPRSERILAAFSVAIIAALIGWPLYTLLSGL